MYLVCEEKTRAFIMGQGEDITKPFIIVQLVKKDT
jgi:hypothetical protein